MALTLPANLSLFASQPLYPWSPASPFGGVVQKRTSLFVPARPSEDASRPLYGPA
jgi:hypothetical protein